MGFCLISQLDSSLTRWHSGTGLVLVRLLAELHGRHVGAEGLPGLRSRIHLPRRQIREAQIGEGHRW